MMKKSILLMLSIALTLTSGFAVSQERGIGGVESLRGNVELEVTRAADP